MTDEQKPKTIEETSSEDLGLLLNQNYQTLLQAQNNITIINQALEKRKGDNNAANTGRQNL